MEPVVVVLGGPPGPGAKAIVKEAIERVRDDGKSDLVRAVLEAVEGLPEFVEVETRDGRGVNVRSIAEEGRYALGPFVVLDGLRELLAPLVACADESDSLGHEDDSTCTYRLKAGWLREVRELVKHEGFLIDPDGPSSVDVDALPVLSDSAVRDDARRVADAARSRFSTSSTVTWPDVAVGTRWIRGGLTQVWVVDECDERTAKLVREGAPVGYVSIPVPSLRHGDNGWRPA